ncbi:MAG: hypothetical protein CR963_00330 [Gammaproteobacteria bacterium]|nr:MAG: hypothetical protein CR963_00330 [Gammaproteobacteria bacterium]
MPKSTAPPAAITLQAVNLQYQNKPILQSLSLSFAPRGISFLMGENGAGKTQMLRCIHGLSTPNSGHISAPPIEQQAFLQQIPILLNRSVLANLRFIRGCPMAPAAHFDREFANVIERFTLGDLLSQAALTLSGGQRKRLAAARLFLQQANCYLLDEPGANIDQHNSRLIESAIQQRVDSGAKAIVTTHDFFQLQRLFRPGRDEMIIIKNGQLAATSRHPDSELLRRYL